MKRTLLFCLVGILTIISCKKINESDIIVKSIYPGTDGPGAVITIHGKGFGSNPTTTAVYFNGDKATTIDSLSDSVIYVEIPAGATTGPITVSSADHHAYKGDSNYVILSGTWVQKANFPGAPRTAPATFTINNIGYVLTGQSWTGPVLADMYAYDPVADTWTQKASLPGSGRYGAIAMTIRNKGYIIGGSDLHQNLPDIWEYDPSTNSWTQKTNFPGGPRSSPGGFSVGGMGYYGLGYGGAPDYSSQTDWWQYNPATDTWNRKADITFNTYAAYYGFTISSTGYLLTSSDYRNWYSYDTATDQWTLENGIPYAIDIGGLQTSTGNYGFFIVPGGFHETWVFDAATASWSRQTSLDPIRYNAAAVGLNNHLYMGLGYEISYGFYFSYPNDWWMLQP